MKHDVNEFGQPIGFAVEHWRPPPLPKRDTIQGRLCRLEPLEAGRHARALFEANSLDSNGRNWTYLSYEPFRTLETYTQWIAEVSARDDPLFFTIVDQRTDKAVGVAAYLRISPSDGTIEVGHINYSPLLQRTAAATEAMYLMMRHVFVLGYRRYEWKCDALNGPSRASAQRLGFSFEGVFRQATVYKRRNRDTAWYAALDVEWPELQRAFCSWLDPANFDSQGKQRVRLGLLTGPLLKHRG